MNYELIATVEHFKLKNKSLVFKFGTKQIYVFEVDGKIFALDNRCPHEGYPLSEGTFSGKKCVLTCNWHNWKFSAETGECLVGDDNIRTYPVKIENGNIFVNIKDPDKEEIQRNLMINFKEAFLERQYGRMSRELIRAKFSELDILDFVREVLLMSYDKFEYGMGHAFPALADWLALFYENNNSLPEQIICLLEAFDHFSHDTLREKSYPYTQETKEYDEKNFMRAIEDEDELAAISYINGAFSNGFSFSSFASVFTKIALEHYNDFGHSLIYVYKCKQISNTLKDLKIDKCLALCLVRSFVYATREDLIPEFVDYKAHLERFNNIQPPEQTLEINLRSLLGCKVKKSLAWVTESAFSVSYEDLYETLLTVNAMNMFRFNTDYQNASKNPVTQNVGWLDFTHAITFANAVRSLCEKDSDLWKKGLLQMACFYGRNSAFTLGEIDEKEWMVVNIDSFLKKVKEQIFDHGLSLPIYSCHYLKTSLAIIEEMSHVGEECQKYLLMALNRYLNSTLKQKHVRRTVLQNIKLITKDF